MTWRERVLTVCTAASLFAVAVLFSAFMKSERASVEAVTVAFACGYLDGQVAVAKVLAPQIPHGELTTACKELRTLAARNGFNPGPAEPAATQGATTP